MTWVKRISLISVFVLGGIQLVQPEKTNPTVYEDRILQRTLEVPPEITSIIDRSCSDCHSFKTTWPWYSAIAPISWYLIHDVNEGRRELNFSEWRNYTPKRAARKLEEICSEVQKGNMPLKSYAFVHPEAKLSNREKEQLCTWTKETRARLIPEPNTGQ